MSFADATPAVELTGRARRRRLRRKRFLRRPFAVLGLSVAFPFLILAVGLAAILGPSLRNATIALGVAAVPGLIRVARGEALALREEDYVRAAIANGATDARILSRHILPNMASTLIVQAT